MMKKLILFFSILSLSQFSYGQEPIDVCYYTYVEEMPLFKNATNQKESLKLLDDYIKGRVKSDSLTVKGIVRLSFVIDPTGAPVEVEILTSLDPIADKVAMNYLKEMPHWRPGKQRGETVYVRESVAVKFE